VLIVVYGNSVLCIMYYKFCVCVFVCVCVLVLP
jgi:hypothetical protein